MKNFLAVTFLFFCIAVIPVKLVQSGEIVDYVLAEINGKEIVKFSDMQMEEKFQKVGCLPPLFEDFRSKNNLEVLVDESILAQIGLKKIEEYISSVNRNFGMWVEKRDEWVRGEDVLQIWSGHMDDFFKKVILLGKIDEEDGKDLKKLIRDWKNLLLVELFFPDESCFKRRGDVRKIISITADRLDATFSYVERRFLKRALAKNALEDLEEKVEHIFVLPNEIKKYCEQHLFSLLEFQHLLVKTEKEAVVILEKIDANKGSIGLCDFGGFKTSGLGLESLIPEFREGILRVADKGLEMGYVKTDIGFHVMQVQKKPFHDS